MPAFHSVLFAAVLPILLLVGPSTAQAQKAPLDDPYFAAKLLLGLGGEVEVEDTDDDLLLSYGVGIEYIHPLHKYFALGGMLGLQSWQSESLDDADADRNMLFDLALLPQGRLPLTDAVELYAMLPLGVSLDSIGEDNLGVTVAGVSAGGEIDTAVGFTVGLLLGARFALSDGFGLLAELGYVSHSYEHEVTVGAGPLNTSANVDLSLAQFALNAGLYF